MAKIEAIVLVFLVFFSSPWIAHAAGKSVATARKEDVPFIKCQVCEKIAAQLYQQVQKKESQISPKKVSEFQIIEIAENLCNLKKEEGDWIFQIDIVEKGDVLEVALELLLQQSASSYQQPNSGNRLLAAHLLNKALKESATLNARPLNELVMRCKGLNVLPALILVIVEVFGYSDTDVAEFLFRKKPEMDSLVKFFCQDLTGVCSTKPPPLPKNRVPGEPFQPKSSKEAEMEKILRSMQGIPGAPSMKMYSKEDILNNNFEDEGADDDEEEDSFPSKLGKVLKDKQAQNTDWKQKTLKVFRESVSSVSRRINKASRRLQDWWKGKKTISKHPKANTEL